MEEAIRALLLANSGVSGLVANRVHWVNRPQGSVLPAIVLHRISGQPDVHYRGESGLVQTRVQADCYGRTYASSVGVARALQAVLGGYSGTFSGVRFSPITIDSIRSDYESAEPDEIYLTGVDLLIWHGPA